MAQSTLIQNIEHLVSINVISEADLAEAINVKLAETGLSLTGASPAKVSKRKPAAKAAGKTSRGKRTEYPDKRNNNHAILLAVKQCGKNGGDSAAIQAKLKDMDHVLKTGTFNTTKSNLTNKYGCLKASGKARSKVFTLSKDGEEELARYEAEFKENGKS